jgi:hypothetical protein
MKILTLKEFIKNLNDFAGDAKNIVIATYNGIDGYREGVATLDAHGKQLKVICGGGDFAGLDTDLGVIQNPKAQSTKDVGAKIVAGELSETPEGTCAILYAGIPRFDEMAELAEALTQRGVKVALLTCGCDTDDVFYGVKSEFRNSIVGIIPRHIVCNGGREDLAEIVAKFLG